MSFNKKIRKLVHDKYDGKCAYCGCDLNGKFQVDHCIPESRFIECVRNGFQIPDHLKITEYDCNQLGNLMPACGSCNNYKSSHTLKVFRSEVGELVRRLNSTFTQYKIAKRFGLITETKNEVVFYFESLNKNLKANNKVNL